MHKNSHALPPGKRRSAQKSLWFFPGFWPFVKSKCTKKQKYFSGGQNEGYFFPEKLLGAQITEHFAGVVV